MTNPESSPDLAACSKCGKCRSVCPTFLEEKHEALVARGRIHLSEAFASGNLPASETYKKALATCLVCMRCTETCPNNVAIDDVMVKARGALNQKLKKSFLEDFVFKYVISRRRPLFAAAKTMGLTGRVASATHLTGAYRRVLKSLSIDPKRKLPEFQTRTLFDRHPEVIQAPGNTRSALYFPGCSASLALTGLGEAVITSLLRNGTDVIMPRTVCCGMPVYMSGDVQTAEKIARQNLEMLKARSVDVLITSCGSCGYMLGNFYKKMLGDSAHDLKIMDISEYLLETGVRPGSRSLDTIATYHDPCHLKRGMKVWEAPRRLLERLPGLSFIEMTDADACCGAGGSFSLKYYELSRKIRANKLNMFQRTHAQVLTTGCPACIFHLEDGLAERSLGARVKHPVELLAETYGEKEESENV